jgi:hypothetical protein
MTESRKLALSVRHATYLRKNGSRIRATDPEESDARFKELQFARKFFKENSKLAGREYLHYIISLNNKGKLCDRTAQLTRSTL